MLRSERPMDRFLVISPHTVEDCKAAVQQVLFAGYITHFDWGCKDGEHTGWAIIEASSKAEAMMAVPPLVRHDAHVVQLTKFTPEEVRAMHGMK